MRQHIFIVLIVVSVTGLVCQTRRESPMSKPNSALSDSLTLVDPVIELPRILKKPTMRYPYNLRPTKQVIVYVKATIDTLGHISDIAVVRRSDTPFDTLAVQLAAEYKFSPGKIDGRVTIQTVSWAIEFTPAESK